MYAGVGMLFTSHVALAEIQSGIEKIDDGLKWPNSGDPIETIQSFIKSLLLYLGLIMVVMALYGGWRILTSGDEDEGKEAGKKIIINAVIGVIVIFFAYTITNLLFSILSGDTVGG